MSGLPESLTPLVTYVGTHLTGARSGRGFRHHLLRLAASDSSLLIMDEKRGRKVSHALGLRITGAAGLLGHSAGAGLIDS